MADIQFLNNIDLKQNQLLNARVHVNGSAPAGSGKGSIWLNSTTNELNFHNGTTFVSVLDDTTISNTFRTVTAGGNTLGATETLAFTQGSNITITENAGAVTIAGTANTQNAYAVSIPSSTTKLRLSGSGADGNTTDDIEFAGSGVITVTRTSADKFTISSSAQANVATDLGKTTATGQITITSSTGNNVVIGEATGSIAGLMSTTHHNKLDGIENGATGDQTASEIRDLLGTGNGNLVPSAGSSGQFLKHDGTFGTPSYIANTNTGADMTQATLKTKLAAGFASNAVQIGDSNDVVTIGKDLIITGDLTVSGNTITANVGTLDVEDKNITVNKGSGDTSSTANGAGLTIQDAVNADTDATILWDATNDKFDFSHQIGITGNITASGSLTVNTIDATDYGLQAADIPNLNTSKLTAGTLGVARGGTGLTSISTLLNSNTTASNVGLGNVTNESKATMFTNAALTGNPTAPTQTAGNSSTRIATTAFVAAATASIGKVTKKLSGHASNTTYNMVHDFGTPHVMVQLLDYGNNGSGATYDVVHANIRRNDDNSVDVIFGSAPGTSQDYLVLITKMPAIS
tara:strand:- start:2618 stop:4348 length:1731 start_codon:yes stop_codon:yes gene_type:complete